MKPSLVFYVSLLFVLLSVSLAPPARSADTVNVAIEKRDEKLNRFCYTWVRRRVLTRASVPNAIYEKNIKMAKEQGEMRAAKDGVTDVLEKSKYIESEVGLVKMLFTGGSWVSLSEFTINRDGKSVHARGIIRDPRSKMKTISDEYYFPESAIYFGETSQMESGSKVYPNRPYVVAAKGSFLGSYLGDGTFLSLTPMDFVFLVNINPLSILEGNWKQVKSEGSNITFEHNLNGFAGTLHHTINFDPLQQYVITDCKETQTHISNLNDYKTLHTRSLEGETVIDSFTQTSIIGDETYADTWNLKSVVQSHKVDYGKIPLGVIIADTRLHGANLNSPDVEKALSRDDSDTVQYPWTGQLPSLDELWKLRDKQHGVLTSKSVLVYWMFIPGIILLLTGILLKVRKTRLGKNSTNPKV